MSPFPPIGDLVPHAPPILILDALVAWEPGVAECVTTLRADHPFVADGVVDSVVTIEIMGQAVAACLGHEAFVEGEGVRVGMIIACRKMSLLRPALHVGERLSVFARRIRGNELLSHFDTEVRAQGEPVATAVMTVYHAERPPDG